MAKEDCIVNPNKIALNIMYIDTHQQNYGRWTGYVVMHVFMVRKEINEYDLPGLGVFVLGWDHIDCLKKLQTKCIPFFFKLLFYYWA